MKIHKILNNNVAITNNLQGQEIVVMGRGIAFKKNIGDALLPELIEKTFVLDNTDINYFSKLMENVPKEIILIVENLINRAQIILIPKLHGSLYFVLLDHLYFALERSAQNIYIQNALLWEIKTLYQKEYLLGLESVLSMNKQLSIDLKEDEAGFIALHLVNAQLNETMPDLLKMTQLMQEILNIVKYHFNKDFNVASLSYQRFIMHLKFFVQRLLSNNSILSDDDSLYDAIAKKYTQTLKCTTKIGVYLKANYAHELSKDEQIFLTVHLERIRLEKSNL
ncbi:transcriptional antiterminator [Gammaproteobacteria bacterium]|nr:transcriptional antiterminator [Gammaproteobacteria bacterium]